jgi:nucleoside-diphosphate-sugar epimerase
MSSNFPRNVLITGGAGVLGSRLVRTYLNSGSNVRVVDNLKHGPLNLDPMPAGLEVFQALISQRNVIDPDSNRGETDA